MKAKEANNPWFAYMRPVTGARLRLFCFPYAGGSAAIFRGWQTLVASDIEVCPIELPGRGRRLQEPAFKTIQPLVIALRDAISGWLDKPFAFLGHSMGAVIAFELARELSNTLRLDPVHLFVSGRRAPQIPNTDPPTYKLPEPLFIEELRRLQGTPQEVLENEELLKLLLPLLRSDFELVHTYKYIPGGTLSCPIAVMGGIDDKDVTRDQLQAWREVSCGTFTLEMFSGNHFFVHAAEKLVAASVMRELRQKSLCT
jgi:medium-chain acyl-[acyl-carrier-protein] hydrolase